MKRVIILWGIWLVFGGLSYADDAEQIGEQFRNQTNTESKLQTLKSEIEFDLNPDVEALKTLAANPDLMSTEAAKLKDDPLQEYGDVSLNPVPDTSDICYQPNPLLVQIAAENNTNINLSDSNYPLCGDTPTNCQLAHEGTTGSKSSFVMPSLSLVQHYGISNDDCSNNNDQTISGYFTAYSGDFGVHYRYGGSARCVTGSLYWVYRGSWQLPTSTNVLNEIAGIIVPTNDREIVSSAYCHITTPAEVICDRNVQVYWRSGDCLSRRLMTTYTCGGGDRSDSRTVSVYAHFNDPYRYSARVQCNSVPLSNTYYNSLKTRSDFTLTSETPASYTCSLSNGTYRFYSCYPSEFQNYQLISDSTQIVPSTSEISMSYCVVSKQNNSTLKQDSFKKSCTDSACPVETGEQIVTDCSSADDTAEDFGQVASELSTANEVAGKVTEASSECDGNADCINEKIRLFPGSDKKCRSWRFDQVPAINCCDDYKELCFESGDTRICPSSCSSESIETIKAIDAQTTLKVGEYTDEDCIGSSPLEVCWDTEKYRVYCDFSSPLARIVSNGGRQQLNIGLGSARDPDCRGFTMTEFLTIDFAKIDFEPYMKELGLNRQQIMEAIEQIKRNAGQ